MNVPIWPMVLVSGCNLQNKGAWVDNLRDGLPIGLLVKEGRVVIHVCHQNGERRLGSERRCARVCGHDPQVIRIPLLSVQQLINVDQVDYAVFSSKSKLPIAPFQRHIHIGILAIIWVGDRDSSYILAWLGSLRDSRGAILAEENDGHGWLIVIVVTNVNGQKSIGHLWIMANRL